MLRKVYEIELGSIVYFVSVHVDGVAPRLVLLPGLTADLRLSRSRSSTLKAKLTCLSGTFLRK